jgi:hypothetical protein
VQKVAEGYGADHVTTGAWNKSNRKVAFSQSLENRNERENIKKKEKWKKRK